ncbi:MAG: ATP-dependent sacrificial sulfur transferase LarE [Parasporobacterium sp.]|nr:ATP-dependent sacrificial sulfur transferase LarE [Parasporobacterium sp.]
MTLKEFFKTNPEVAIAFSGGVDSAYLLSEALKYAKRVRAYYVNSQFQPAFELDDALRLAENLSADICIIDADVLSDPEVVKNPKNRCYFCKQRIFNTILERAEADGFSVILDGTNASDNADDRPGMKALRELSVLSPLRECGLTKEEIRKRSKEAGLFTWNKPAYACLATRIPSGEEITEEKLSGVEQAEAFLASLGFSDLRVRTSEGNAKIQLPADQMETLLVHREEVLRELKKTYKTVVLDLESRS